MTPNAAMFMAACPTLDVDNTTIIGLAVTFNLHFVDGTGTVPAYWTAITIDAWSQLSSQQKTNMQDIRDAIVAYVTTTYFT